MIVQSRSSTAQTVNSCCLKPGSVSSVLNCAPSSCTILTVDAWINGPKLLISLWRQKISDMDRSEILRVAEEQETLF